MLADGAFAGAGEPRPELAADEIVPLLHRALALNDFPEVDSGLKSSGRSRHDALHLPE